MRRLLDMPSAVWNGGQWVGETGIEYPSVGEGSIRRCPWRVGIVSTGLMTAGSELRDWLLAMDYGCVILDEALPARRRNPEPAKVFGPPEPNLLLQFIQQISPKTKSMLLATAAPLQMHPIEDWDRLEG